MLKDTDLGRNILAYEIIGATAVNCIGWGSNCGTLKDELIEGYSAYRQDRDLLTAVVRGLGKGMKDNFTTLAGDGVADYLSPYLPSVVVKFESFNKSWDVAKEGVSLLTSEGIKRGMEYLRSSNNYGLELNKKIFKSSFDMTRNLNEQILGSVVNKLPRVPVPGPDPMMTPWDELNEQALTVSNQ